MVPMFVVVGPVSTGAFCAASGICRRAAGLRGATSAEYGHASMGAPVSRVPGVLPRGVAIRGRVFFRHIKQNRVITLAEKQISQTRMGNVSQFFVIARVEQTAEAHPGVQRHHEGTLMAAGDSGKISRMKQTSEVAAPTRQTGRPQPLSGASRVLPRYL